jgi:hypothetical protein
MAEVLAEHWSASTHTERKPFVDKCDGCGDLILSWGDPTVGDGSERLAAHQQAMLAAAGFGLVADAWDEGQKSGMRHADRVIAAHKIGRPELPGPPSPNPYRKASNDDH